jgi:DNA-binding NtrC family response regulator
MPEAAMRSILVWSMDKAACEVIRSCFRSEYQVDLAASGESCLEMLRKKRYEFLFLDLVLLRGSTSANGHPDYRHALQPYWHISPATEVVVMSSQAMIRDGVMAVKAGASNYLTFPISPEEVKFVTESIYNTIRIQSELTYLRDRFWKNDAREVVRTNSPLMQEVFNKVRSVAPTKSTVLLTGDTGTGKGVVAGLIHRHSNRSERQYISIHCGAIPDTLIESELFGHEKGAFTGADRRKLGKFEIAKSGTIFLDEIGTVTPSAQIKLLQVLHEKTFQRVGGKETIDADVRVIAATNSDLKAMVDQGLYRDDLYYRLSVFPIEIPALRERKEDIPILVEILLNRLNKLYFKEIHDVHPDVIEAFERYSWPGNIRELENIIERAYILESSPVLTPKSFPLEFFTRGTSFSHVNLDTSLSLAEVRRRAVEEIERRYVRELLTQHRGRIQTTAAAAGITTRQLHKIMKRYDLDKRDFRRHA